MVEAAGVDFSSVIEPAQVTGKPETPETLQRIKNPIRRTYYTRGPRQYLVGKTLNTRPSLFRGYQCCPRSSPPRRQECHTTREPGERLRAGHEPPGPRETAPA